MAAEVYARVKGCRVTEQMRIPHPVTCRPVEVARRIEVYGTDGLAEIWLWVDEVTAVKVRPDEAVAVWREAEAS